MTGAERELLENQIGQWRTYLQRRQAIQSADVAELEDHLRERIEALSAGGLSGDEAFLVAVKRLGAIDALSREFAREHSDRLWKQLLLAPAEDAQARRAMRIDALVALSLALCAAIAIKAPALFGLHLNTAFEFYARNASLFVLPLLAGYFAGKRQISAATFGWLAAGFLLALVFANIYPFAPRVSTTESLTALHLPIALWLAVGVAYAGGKWGEGAKRMDFIRFSGELFIYFVLIALGGGALTAFMALIFQAAGIDIEPFFENWLLPCGAVGGVIVAAWLVEAKQSVIENMAPVLARLFAPLFVIVLLVFLGALLVTGRGLDIERNVLIAFDLLLVLVLGLLLYSISARTHGAPPGVFDILQIVLLVCALAADMVALSAIAARINEFGFTANRVAALGENIILLVNLAWSAVLYVRFVRGQGAIDALEQWQTNYLTVFAGWAAIVVVMFPPLFGFM